MKILENKWLRLIFAFLISVLAVLSIVLCFQGSKKDVLSIRFDEEAYITNIKIGETNYPFKMFSNNENIKIEEDKIYVPANTIFEYEISKLHNIDISLKSDKENCTITILSENDKVVEVNKEESHYILNSRLSTNIIEFFSELSLLNYIVLFFIYILLFILIYFAISYINLYCKLLQNNEVKFVNLILLQVSFLAIFLSCYTLLLQIFKALVLIPIGLFVFLFIYINRKNILNNLPQIFIFIVTILGLVMAMTLPPFHIPDEATHFFKAYSIINPEKIKIDEKGEIRSFALLELTETVGVPIDKYNMDIFNSNYTVSAKEYFVDSSYFYNESDAKVDFNFSNTYNLTELAYIPATITIFIGQIIKIPFMFIVLLSRIINLFVYSTICYYSIKIVPKYKKIFFTVMLLPIALQQATGISQDCITYSVIFITISYLMNLIYNEESKINIKSIIIMVTLSLFLGFCKIGYYPILLLVFLIPSKKFKNRYIEYLTKVGVLIPCFFLSFRQYFIVANTNETVGAAYYPVSYVFQHPFKVAEVFINTIFWRFHLDLLTGLVNGFGWSTVWSKELISFSSAIIFLIILISNNNEEIKIKHRIVYALITILIFGMIYASLFFGWTKLGEPVIDGLQCRYFVPVTLMFFITLVNKNIKLDLKNKNLYMVCGILLVDIMSFYTIISSYYF